MLQLEPYKGSNRRLVIAIDVGTTYSGAAYCILDPGEIPKVLSITRFPGQEGDNRSRDVKIPSCLYYDQQNKLRAVGAEATLQNTQREAYTQEWTYVRWFKLHLRPPSILPGAILPPINVNKPVLEILADYLAYVLKCSKRFISETSPIGRKILDTEGASALPIDYVLSHPNGWSGPQQNNMRRAAVMAGLVSDSDEGMSRLQFVTEGEASLQFCIATGLVNHIQQENNYVTIVDCGGGTIDLSTYRVVDSAPVTVEESVNPECLIQGSSMINHRAEALLRDKLRNSCFSTNEDIESMMANFDSTTKPIFRDPSAMSHIKFGGARDTDVRYNIRRGYLDLSGPEMVSLFAPSIDALKAAIDTQVSGMDHRLAAILLVGGFASSPFLRDELQAHMTRKGLRMFCPEGQTSKAVAEGALWFYLDHRVRARVARHTYGSACNVHYDPLNPEHLRRKHLTITNAAGATMVRFAFATIAQKGTVVTETTEFRCHLAQHSEISAISGDTDAISASVISYRGSKTKPAWRDDEPEMFNKLCRVRGVPASDSWQTRDGPNGPYRYHPFDIILLLGLTEMKAQISWWEDVRAQST
ncbi:hypothetical protein DAEQUDRAFT_676500 [Daedalea quercina L-15889]|uniref:Actin-like ATPase domain-containing protein n=1 Tax=Daedalea quercina L-15889 TaxID=1314783 RepID=A0A165MGA2_9APHY|nr:hypothetical protein DAEQUDRAFT_676500 [Daedalea quercina L-15889]